MRTNKVFLWIAASMLTGAFCAASAFAMPEHPEAYKSLSAVEGEAPAQAPATAHGFGGLAGEERHYREALPLQLSGPVKKVKAAKYKQASFKGHKAKAKSKPAKKAKSRAKRA